MKLMRSLPRTPTLQIVPKIQHAVRTNTENPPSG